MINYRGDFSSADDADDADLTTGVYHNAELLSFCHVPAPDGCQVAQSKGLTIY